MQAISLTLALLSPLALFPRVLTSTATGNWNTAATWGGAGIPAGGDTIIISDGHTVTIDGNLTYAPPAMLVEVFGTWLFSGGGAKITLPEGSGVIIHVGASVTSTAPGNGGSSQRIIIGSTTYWQGGSNSTVEGPWAWPIGLLPVDLLHFGASASGDEVQLRWTTASETNSSHFEVQRSTDRDHWILAGALDAAGQSMQMIAYALTESHVPPGLWYYRLEQVDLDGTRHSYHEVPVQVQGVQEPMRCTVDPYHPGTIHVHAAFDAMRVAPPMLIETGTGRTTATELVHASDTGFAVRVSHLSSGVHVLRMAGMQDGRSCRFMVAR